MKGLPTGGGAGGMKRLAFQSRSKGFGTEGVPTKEMAAAGEPAMPTAGKRKRKRGGKVSGKKPVHRLDKRARGGHLDSGTHEFNVPSGGVSAHGRREAKKKGDTLPGTDKFPIRNLCLDGDTPIPLLNGDVAVLREIAAGAWAYGFDVAMKAIVPVQIEKVWLTRKGAPIVEVVLDDGAVVRCTDNHPFLLRDGSYREARALSIGDALMPLYRKWHALQKRGAPEYEHVFQPFYGFWEPTHRMSYRGHNGALPAPRLLIHHDDGSELNNVPPNLVAVTRSQHRALHFSLDPEAVRTGLDHARRIRWADPAQRQAASERMQRENASRKENGQIIEIGDRIRAKKTGMQYRNSPNIDTAEAKRRYLEGESLRSLARFWDTSADAIKRRLRHAGVTIRGYQASSSLRDRDPMTGHYANHKVVAVRAAGIADVYDLSVPRTCNVALGVGVFVHNSDLAKAKHDIGRTTEPRSKVVAYIDREAKKLGGRPVGERKKK